MRACPWSSPDLGGRFEIRPGIDGGSGDGLRLGNINIDLIVPSPVGTNGMEFDPGRRSGHYDREVHRRLRKSGSPELHAGGSYLFGFQHDNGFFADFRVGGGSFVPQLKIGVRWSVEIK